MCQRLSDIYHAMLRAILVRIAPDSRWFMHELDRYYSDDRWFING